jgi:uncharacterized Fe-S center protein
MSTVYLLPIDRQASDADTAAGLDALWRAAGLAEVFTAHDLAALKLHVGEPGTKTFVRPVIAANLVRLIAATGAEPFLTDTAVLYKSPRDNAVGHARVAAAHGFGADRVGAPFIPADGLHGADEIELEVNGRHYDTAAIATAIVQARSMLVLSHATGHLGVGFGGALKNLGMGCSSKKAKLRQHHGQQPRIDPDSCTACATCAEWCPSDAITVADTAEIDAAECIGCGECVAVCRDGAVHFDWGIMGRELSERIVEHAAALVRHKPDRLAYVTVAQAITKDCDCLGVAQEPLLDDVGILAARDPVAIDKAILDLVTERAGRTLEAMSYPGHDATLQMRYAAELGLGDLDYELVTVGG